MGLTITTLVDNNVSKNLQAEWGLSFFIIANGRKILFDTGASDLFLKNACKLNIDLIDLDYIVFSHGHWDHTWGFHHLLKHNLSLNKTTNNTKVIAHPDCFNQKKRSDDSELGAIINPALINTYFQPELSRTPIQLTENLFFLGEIERKFSFETTKAIGTVFKNDIFVDDFLVDDTALVYRAKEGLIIITGCSHSGICNTVEYAKNMLAEERVLAVIGGLHLLEPEQAQLSYTIEYFNKIAIPTIYPCHCTDLASKIALANKLNVKDVFTGFTLEFN